MPDYSQHKMKNWEWFNRYRSQMGKEFLETYINDAYKFLLAMQPGTFFTIEKNVKPENIDLFIKVCCMFIDERHHANQKLETSYVFSDDYSYITHKK